MSTVTQLLCNNFGGIRQKSAIFNESLISAQDSQNVELYYTEINGGVGLRTAKGNYAINSDLEDTETIINEWSSLQNGVTYWFIHTETETQGKIYQYNYLTDTLTAKKTGLSVTGDSVGFDIAQGYSDLFFFSNGAEMLTIEMATDEITMMTPTDVDGNTVLGLVCKPFDGRLWVANKNKCWYSMQSDIYDFHTHSADYSTSAGYIEFTKDITAMHEYLNSLAIFHKDSSELLSINDAGEISRKDESPGGCCSYNALIFHDTNLYFYDDTKKSVFSFQQVVTGQKTLGQNVAIEVQDILNDIDSTKLNTIRTLSVFIEGRNEIWWLLPTKDDNYSTILIYDYLKGEWLKRKSQKISALCIVNDKIYSGSTNGIILEEYKTNTFNGEFIQHYYKCSPFNLGAMNTLKVLLFPPRVTFDMPYKNNFYIKYTKNYDVIRKPKVKHIKTKNKGLYYCDKDFCDSAYCAPRRTGERGKFPNATFKILEMEIYTQDNTNDFCIKNIEFSKVKVKQV